VARKALGIVITCTGNAAVSGTYPLDAETVLEFGICARDSAGGLGMPGSISTFVYKDMAGASHTFFLTTM
jgi:hypothetical protein